MNSVITKVRSIIQPSHLVLISLFATFYAFTVSSNYELKTVSVAADKMNVFYIGVENPITVAVEGVPSRNVTVTSKDVQLIDKGKGRYAVTASKPGEAILLVSANGMEPQKIRFRVKRIPDPVATLENPNLYFKTEGTVTAEDFKETAGVMLNMDGCFDYDHKLKVAEFSILKVPKMGDPVEVYCRDGKLTDTAKKLIDSAVPGDTFYFEMIKSKEVESNTERKLNSMVFRIK
jgi:hypothetical protein